MSGTVISDRELNGIVLDQMEEFASKNEAFTPWQVQVALHGKFPTIDLPIEKIRAAVFFNLDHLVSGSPLQGWVYEWRSYNGVDARTLFNPRVPFVTVSSLPARVGTPAPLPLPAPLPPKLPPSVPQPTPKPTPVINKAQQLAEALKGMIGDPE